MRMSNHFLLLIFLLGILLSPHGTKASENGDGDNDGDGDDQVEITTTEESASGTTGQAGETHKHLVVFAGPHKTYETSIEEFFYTYAGNDRRTDDNDDESALHGWIWPRPPDGDASAHLTVDGDLKPHQIYEHLVLQTDDEDLQKELMDVLKAGFDQSTEGIIIGSEEFDRVGQTPDTHANAIDAVVRVKEYLGVTDHHITIVLLYKTPRVDQWVAMFNFLYLNFCKFLVSPVGQDSNEKYAQCYKDYICDQTSWEKPWETLHTAMNTLHVARAYRAQGWDVVLIDVDGAKDAKRDIEHIIGCEVLGANCDDDGWLIGLKGQTFETDADIFDSGNERKFTALSDKQEFDLENMFRMRDCNHEETLRVDEDFYILYRKSVFMGCSEVNQNLVTALQDPDFVLDAVRSQKDCSKEPMNLRDVLSGQATVSEEDPRNQHYRDEFDNNNGRKALGWIIPFTLFVLVGLVFWNRAELAQRVNRHQNYGGMPYVIETARLNNQRPLSALT